MSAYVSVLQHLSAYESSRGRKCDKNRIRQHASREIRHFRVLGPLFKGLPFRGAKENALMPPALNLEVVSPPKLVATNPLLRRLEARHRRCICSRRTHILQYEDTYIAVLVALLLPRIHSSAAWKPGAAAAKRWSCCVSICTFVLVKVGNCMPGPCCGVYT